MINFKIRAKYNNIIINFISFFLDKNMKGNYLISNIYKSYYIQQAVMARVSIA